MQNKYFKYLLLAPALTLVALVTFYPLLRSFWISLHDWDLKESVEIGDFIGFNNYLQAMTDSHFWNSVLVTLIFTIVAVVLTIALAMAVAIVLSKEKRYITMVRAVLIIPFALSPALVGYSWRFMLNSDYGLFDKIISTLIPPLQDVVWLGSAVTSMLALISVVIWIWLPFMSLMFISGIIGLPQEVFEAAKVDGANWYQVIFKIMLPMLRPIILIATILMTMFTLKQFDPVVTLTHGGPGTSTEVLNFFIYKQGFRFFDMGYSSAVGYILAFITVIFVVFYMRKLVKGDDWN